MLQFHCDSRPKKCDHHDARPNRGLFVIVLKINHEKQTCSQPLEHQAAKKNSTLSYICYTTQMDWIFPKACSNMTKQTIKNISSFHLIQAMIRFIDLISMLISMKNSVNIRLVLNLKVMG